MSKKEQYEANQIASQHMNKLMKLLGCDVVMVITAKKEKQNIDLSIHCTDNDVVPSLLSTAKIVVDKEDISETIN